MTGMTRNLDGWTEPTRAQHETTVALGDLCPRCRPERYAAVGARHKAGG